MKAKSNDALPRSKAVSATDIIHVVLFAATALTAIVFWVALFYCFFKVIGT